jgi:hypothetical protein
MFPASPFVPIVARPSLRVAARYLSGARAVVLIEVVGFLHRKGVTGRMASPQARILTLLGAGALAATVALAGPGPRGAQGATRMAAPCMPAGYGTPGATPVISFGHSGGNIRPSKIAIYSNGTIIYQGANPLSTSYHILPEAVLGLQRLAQAEGFASMPSLIKAPHWLPDFGFTFISIRAGCSSATQTVKAQGMGSGNFTELYATLAAATALQV